MRQPAGKCRVKKHAHVVSTTRSLIRVAGARALVASSLGTAFVPIM